MRLIDADAMKERILLERDKIPLLVLAAPYEFVKKKPNQHGNAMRGGIRVALRCMEQTPTIDAVPVVRCRECKHRGSPYNCPMRNLVMPFSGPGSYADYTEDDGFCHKGEKKDGVA